MKNQNPTIFPRRGFTLLELMIVIVVIMVLVGILVPAISYAKRIANKSATQSLLQTITTGIDAYYTDFSMYPPSSPNYGNYIGATFHSGDPSNSSSPSGAEILAECMTGYLPGSGDGAGADLNANDPAYGFRITAHGNGRIYGPYVEPNPKMFKLVNSTDAAFIDLWGNWILYYRAVPAKLNGQGRNISLVFDGNNLDANGNPTQNFTAIFMTGDNSSVVDGNGKPAGDPAVVTTNGTITTSRAFWESLGCTIDLPSNDNSQNNQVGPSSLIVGRDNYLLISAGPPDALPSGQYFGRYSIIQARK